MSIAYLLHTETESGQPQQPLWSVTTSSRLASIVQISTTLCLPWR
jgi:hypothetical protein